MLHQLLWTPSQDRIERSNAKRYMDTIAKNAGFSGSSFHDLWKWSVENPTVFWNSIWDFCDIIGDKGERLSNGAEKFWEHRYFPDARLNFAENLFRTI